MLSYPNESSFPLKHCIPLLRQASGRTIFLVVALLVVVLVQATVTFAWEGDSYKSSEFGDGHDHSPYSHDGGFSRETYDGDFDDHKDW